MALQTPLMMSAWFVTIAGVAALCVALLVAVLFGN
jgi:hypothetical protein